MKFYQTSRWANLCLNELNINSEALRKSFSQLERNQVLTIDAHGGGGTLCTPSKDFEKFGQKCNKTRK